MKSYINLITSNKNIFKLNFFKFIAVLIVIFPVKGFGYLSGFPIKTDIELVCILVVVITILKIQKINIYNLLIFTFVIGFKIYLVTFPQEVWSVCVEDYNTPKQTQFNYEYYQKECVDSFDLLFSKFTETKFDIDYQSLDDSQHWRGANNTNLPLGFFNQSAFNFYEKRRDWLPFSLYMEHRNKSNYSYLSIEYIGRVSIQFDDEYLISLPSSYEKIAESNIKIPKGAAIINVKYHYKDRNVLQDSTHPFEYPNDYTEGLKYGHLNVSILDMNFDKISIKKYYELSIFIVIIFFLLNFHIYKLITKQEIIWIVATGLLLVLAYANFEFQFLRQFNGIILLLLFTYFSNIKNIELIYFLSLYFTLSLLFIDPPWNTLDFLIKPSGSDILTYENQARLILSGDGLRGGADIFWYSPGYRYLLFIIHVIFGDGWSVAWKFILTSTAFILLKINSDKDIFLKTTSFLLVLFLFSDNIRTLYLYGMSETLSLLFFLMGLYITNFRVSSLFILIATLIRPEILLVALLIVYLKRKNQAPILFIIGLFLPLIHNLYFGQEFVLFSTAATYGRNLTFKFFENINYLIFNPFNSSISNILGFMITLIAFMIIILSIARNISLFIKEKDVKKFINVLVWILAISPYIIYDPKLFYPRHVLISLVLIGVNFENLLSDYKYKNIKNNKK